MQILLANFISDIRKYVIYILIYFYDAKIGIQLSFINNLLTI